MTLRVSRMNCRGGCCPMPSGLRYRVLAMRAVVLTTALLSVLITLARLAEAATINVTTTTDEIAANRLCSLREAIRAANLNAAIGGCPAGTGFDHIVIPAGTYHLTIPGAGEIDDLSGDLAIRSPLSL